MTKNDSSIENILTHKQQRAVAALLEARTIENAARQAGVSERTLYRWMKIPEFIRACRTAEGEAIGEAVRVLIADIKENHQVLRTLRDDKELPANVRRLAAVALDDSLLRWRELLNDEQRISRLEEIIYGQK